MSARALFTSVCFYCAVALLVTATLMASGKFQPNGWGLLVISLVAHVAGLTACWSRGVRGAFDPQGALDSAMRAAPPEIARATARKSLNPPPPADPVPTSPGAYKGPSSGGPALVLLAAASLSALLFGGCATMTAARPVAEQCDKTTGPVRTFVDAVAADVGGTLAEEVADALARVACEVYGLAKVAHEAKVAAAVRP